MEKTPDISNRESVSEESAERAAHPPLDTGPCAPVDAADRTGERPTGDRSDFQTWGEDRSHSTALETLQTESADAMRDAVTTLEPAESRMERIAKRAHEIYEARGGQHGKALEDWLTAERQIDDEIDWSLRDERPDIRN
jgi:hypothetical protein